MFKKKAQAGIEVIILLLALALVIPSLFFGQAPDKSLYIILGIVVFFISFSNINLALSILILSMLLSPEFRAGAVTGRAVVIRADDIFIIIIFMGWLAKTAVNKEIGILRNSSLNIPIMLYVFICILSTWFGIIDGLVKPREALFYNLKYIEYYLVFFMVRNNVKSMKQVKGYIYLLLFTAFLVCLLSWRQASSTQRFSTPFEGGGGEPATLAAYLLLMMALGFSLFCYVNSTKVRAALGIFLALAFFCFIRTLTRGAWIAFFPMFIALALFNRKFRMPLLVLLVFGIIFLPAIMPKIVEKRMQETLNPEVRYKIFDKYYMISESTAARLQSWVTASQILSYRPILGAGIPSSAVVDNQYARVLVETGLVGFAVFFWMMLAIYQLCIRAYNFYKGSGMAEGISLGLLAGFIGLLFQSFSAGIFILIRVMEPFWFLVAIVAALPEIEADNA